MAKANKKLYKTFIPRLYIKVVWSGNRLLLKAKKFNMGESNRYKNYTYRLTLTIV